MTTAVAWARALLDQPAPDPIPGQLDLEHDMTDRFAHLAPLAVACPKCGSKPGALCRSHNGSRPRVHDVHQARTRAHAVAQQTTTRSN